MHRSLTVPKEIRNQIYSLVLGTNSLHVYARKSADAESTKAAKVDYYTCLAPTSNHTHHASATARNTGHAQPEWLDQHLPCFTAGSSHLPNLQIMLTCRQIYTETRLLPYSTNEFIFVGPSSLQTFVECALKPDQVQALRCFSIWTAVCPTVPTPAGMVSAESVDTTTTWKTWVPSKKIVEEGLLRSIQELRLSVSVFASEAAEGEWRDVKEIQGVFGFGALAGLERVSVVVGQDEESGLGDGREVIRTYAKEVRERLLGTYIPRPVVVYEE
jgi:hypothetical protein